MSTSPELKACPFCNHAAYLATWTERIEIGWDSGLGSPSPMFNTHHEVRCGDKEKFHNAGCGAKVRGDSEAEAIANWNRRASLSERDAVTPTGGYINTVGALREAFATLPDNAPLIVQVVAQDKTVWNVWAKAALGKDCGFKWKVNPAILSLSHPDLHTLSASGDAAPPRDTERLDEIQARYIGANFRYDFDDVTQGCAIIIQIETSAKVTGDIRKDVDALLAARNSKSETPRTP